MKRENPAHAVLRRYNAEKREKQRRKGRNHSCYNNQRVAAIDRHMYATRRMPQPDPTTKSGVRGWRRGDPMNYYST